LDNYHEVGADSSLHLALNAAFAEVPPAGNVIIISRRDAPAVFSRLQLTDAIAVIDWEALRLSEVETAALIRSRSSFDAQTVAAIYARAGGWVAGVRLLLERLDGKSAGPAPHHPEMLESAFIISLPRSLTRRRRRCAKCCCAQRACRGSVPR
jgi:ATP/maltotriose-dependent transcriptional regulator MalT